MINHLWSGCITGRDEALQLILIVDHIVDWARDVFRPNITRKLRSLTCGDFSDQTTIDSDVMSLKRDSSYVAEWARTQARSEVAPEERVEVPDQPIDPQPPITQDTLKQLSSKHGLVKDARPIESRLKGLLITRDSLKSILLAYKSLVKKNLFISQVVSILDNEGVMLKDRDALSRVEDFWAGYSCGHSNSTSITKGRIYAHFQISYYIDSSWNQVRELAYLAVEAEALELPLLSDAFDARSSSRSFRQQEVEVARIVAGLYMMQERSVRQDMVSALCRRTYRMTSEKSRSSNLCWRRAFLVDVQGLAREISGSAPVTFKQDRDAESPGNEMLRIVDETFERLCRSNQEFTASFLRQASRTDMEGRPLWKGWTPAARLEPKYNHLDKILVHSIPSPTGPSPDPSPQKYCLYIMTDCQDAPDQFCAAITTKLQQFLDREALYSTMRGARFPCAGSDGWWCDNRVQYWFSLRSPDTERDIMLYKKEFQLELESWRMMLFNLNHPKSCEDVNILGSKKCSGVDGPRMPNISAVRRAAV